MAELVVTYSNVSSGREYDPPIASGSGVRTEVVAFGANGSLTVSSEQVVELVADEDCWVIIGVGVVHGDADTGRMIKANLPYTFGVSEGERVAVAAVA